MGMEPTFEAEYKPFPVKGSRNTRQQHLEVPLFVGLLGLAGRPRILEVGCGVGVALPVLHRICAPKLLMGLDIDAAALEVAAGQTLGLTPRVELVQADARSMPVRTASFDAVVDFGTCYHIAHGDHAIQEIERVLKVRGVFATETKLNQFMSHPIRSHGRTLNLRGSRRLRLQRHCGLWMAWERC